MMAFKKPPQVDLFGVPKDIGAYVAPDHLLRQVAAQIDFDFVYGAVANKYGVAGHESTPPPVILKLMLLLTLYNVSGARELMRTLPYRVDWLWFVGYQLGEKVPDHSVLSKARKRWGRDVFLGLFQQVLDACREADLVGGTRVHTDASVIEANASIDSLFRTKGTAAVAEAMVERIEDEDSSEGDDDTPPPRSHHQKRSEARYRSSTDPDATGAKQGAERMRPRYKTHRVVDDKAGVITSTHVGPGHENEGEHLARSLDDHEKNTESKVEVLGADSKYGTVENFAVCEQRGTTAYVPPHRSNYKRFRDGRFCDCEFRYDAAADAYICPAGQKLTRKNRRAERNAYRYVAPRKACATCPARRLCTSAKSAPRSLLRQDRQDLLDAAYISIRTTPGRDYRKRRMWVMEGSFARSKRYGYKRARWRGLPALEIQDVLVATAVNLRILLSRTAALMFSRARRFSVFFRTSNLTLFSNWASSTILRAANSVRQPAFAA